MKSSHLMTLVMSSSHLRLSSPAYSHPIRGCCAKFWIILTKLMSCNNRCAVRWVLTISSCRNIYSNEGQAAGCSSLSSLWNSTSTSEIVHLSGCVHHLHAHVGPLYWIWHLQDEEGASNIVKSPRDPGKQPIPYRVACYLCSSWALIRTDSLTSRQPDWKSCNCHRQVDRRLLQVEDHFILCHPMNIVNGLPLPLLYITCQFGVEHFLSFLVTFVDFAKTGPLKGIVIFADSLTRICEETKYTLWSNKVVTDKTCSEGVA